MASGLWLLVPIAIWLLLLWKCRQVPRYGWKQPSTATDRQTLTSNKDLHWSAQIVRRDGIYASKPLSSSDGKDRPDFKAADMVLAKPFAKPFVGLLYPPVQSLVADVLAIPQLKAATVIFPEERPSLCAPELPPPLHHIVIFQLQIRLHIDDNEYYCQTEEPLKYLG
jgi:hypothetical protein